MKIIAGAARQWRIFSRDEYHFYVGMLISIQKISFS
jgi:hypothetical protein